jgi:hypothetical protein
MNVLRLAKLAPAIAVVALALPSSAFGQATRTWVSGVGDDANPCSRTAPCKTFAGAISKTADGGEINCLDPGGFGGVTIGKSLTIKCHYTEGGVLVASTNAIVINAPATAKVTLRGLDIFGAGTGAPTSLVGVKVLSAKVVQIFDSEIYRFKAGIDINPSSSQTRVVVARNHIHDNGVGVLNAPGNNTISFTSAVVRWNEIYDNTCGVVTSSFGANASTPDANTDCGAATAASGISKTAATSLYHNGIGYSSNTGVFARGASATAEIGWNEITNNDLFGLHRIDSATIKTVTGTNVISGNGASDAPNGTATPLTKRQYKHLKRTR